MFKTLVKKQFREILSGFMYKQSKKNGNKSSKGKIILFALLMLYCMIVFAGLFYSTFEMIADSFVPMKLEWLCFAMAGLMATALGVIGSIFATQSQLFEAKDNELLLSLPIKPSKILFCRMLVLYVQTFIYEAVVLIPSYLAFCKYPQFCNALSIVVFVIMLIIIPMLGLAVSCLLGWLVALISSKVKRKNIFTVVLSLLFFAGYFYLTTQMNAMLNLIVENSERIGDFMQSAMYPFYKMGLAIQGDVVSLLITVVMVAVVFCIVYYLLSRSFIRIATTKKGGVKIKYREKSLKISNLDVALLSREWKHFVGSPIYLMNCGLGAIIMIFAAVFVIIKGNEFADVIYQVMDKSTVLLAATGIIAFLSSTDLTTAPSISIEGRTLWAIQSLPIPLNKVLMAKIKLHMLVNAIPTVILGIAIAIVFRLNIVSAVLMIFLSIVIIFFNAEMGIIYNLKSPNLEWKNETVAVKQSTSVMFTMFTMWGVVIALMALTMLMAYLINAIMALVIDLFIMVILSLLLMKWINNSGAKKFAEL